MKKVIVALSCAVILTSAFTSCTKIANLLDKKDDHQKNDTTQEVVINKTLKYGETYTLDLNQYEDADDLSAITTQAVKYTISELSGSAVTTDNKYTFQLKTINGIVASDGTTSLETVKLQVTEGVHADGTKGPNVGKVEANITINFTVTQ
jgi:hypothetical protein